MFSEQKCFYFFNYIYKSANVTQLEGAAPCGCGGAGSRQRFPPPRRRRRNSSDSPPALEVAPGSGSVTGPACRPGAGGEELNQTGTQRGGSPGPAGLGGAGGRRRGAGTRRREVPPVPAFVWLGAARVAPADDIATGGRLATVVAVG